MSTKRTTRIETPGEAEAPATDEGIAEGGSEPQAEFQAAADPRLLIPANPEPVTDAEKKRELDRQCAVVAADIAAGSKGALDWSHLTNPAALQAQVNTYVDPDKDLPHPDDIDWKKHPSGKVLTKQGWLIKA